MTQAEKALSAKLEALEAKLDKLLEYVENGGGANAETSGSDVITVDEAARKLGKAPQVVRVMLQKGMLPFGTAIKVPGSTIFTYVIFPQKFREYCGEA